MAVLLRRVSDLQIALTQEAMAHKLAFTMPGSSTGSQDHFARPKLAISEENQNPEVKRNTSHGVGASAAGDRISFSISENPRYPSSMSCRRDTPGDTMKKDAFF